LLFLLLLLLLLLLLKSHSFSIFSMAGKSIIVKRNVPLTKRFHRGDQEVVFGLVIDMYQVALCPPAEVLVGKILIWRL